MGDRLDVRENVIRKFETKFVSLFSDIQCTYMFEGNVILRYKFHEVFTQPYYHPHIYFEEMVMFSVMCVCLPACSRGFHVTTRGPVEVCSLGDPLFQESGPLPTWEPPSLNLFQLVNL